MPSQQTVQLIISPCRRILRKRFVVLPGIIKIKVGFGSATRPSSLSAQVVFSIGKAWGRASVDGRLYSSQTRVDIALREGVNVLLSRLVRSLEIMGDVLQGLAEFGVVHLGTLKGKVGVAMG